MYYGSTGCTIIIPLCDLFKFELGLVTYLNQILMTGFSWHILTRY